jgi:hypothetical protein
MTDSEAREWRASSLTQYPEYVEEATGNTA